MQAAACIVDPVIQQALFGNKLLFVCARTWFTKYDSERGTDQKGEGQVTQMVVIKGFSPRIRCRTFLTPRSAR